LLSSQPVFSPFYSLPNYVSFCTSYTHSHHLCIILILSVTICILPRHLCIIQVHSHHWSPLPPPASASRKYHHFDLTRFLSHRLSLYTVTFASSCALFRALVCRIWSSGHWDIAVFVLKVDGILIRPYILIHGTSSVLSFTVGKAFSAPF
jgi:hypothetical protein